jgi:amidase
MDYKEVVARKTKSLMDSIPKEWILSEIPTVDEQPNVCTYLDSFLPENEQKITSATVAELIKLQEEKKITALDIAYAFCHRAALVHQLTNCCTEIFFERAFETAKALDEYFKETGLLKGKLHGIPISLKDQINLPGITTAIGFVAPHICEEFEKIVTGRPSRDSMSLIAKILEKQGAIFYVKTAVPMGMFGGETASNLGVTYNALDRKMSCGGSSGGEGALIGGGGSIIGLGTDLGGSIRMPSMAQGLFGLRPSSNRFPYLDIANSYPNQTISPSVVGPMCKNIEDLIYISELILSDPMCDRDPKHLPIKWDQDIIRKGLKGKKIKLGILKWDNEVMPHPPILNTIEKVQETLKSAEDKFEVIPLNGSKLPIKLSASAQLLLSLFSCDNYQEIENNCKLSGEKWIPRFERNYPQPGKVDSVIDYQIKAGKKYENQIKFDKIFEQVDCFIMPSFSTVCWKEGEIYKVNNFYTRSINPFDLTSMTFPIGRVTKEDVPFERTNFATEGDKSNWEYYDHESQIGKPVSLQLVCKRYHEEECCAIVKEITEIMKAA